MKLSERNYQKKIEDRVYNVKDYLMILKDVMNDIISQTHHFSDDEIKYVRNKFISFTNKLNLTDDEERSGFEDYFRDIHTLGTEVVQLNKFGKILYDEDDVDKTKKLDEDYFDDREDNRIDSIVIVKDNKEIRKYKSI
jgi:hypothetical protein